QAPIDCDELAHFLYAGIHGAILQSKVDRSPVPLKRFKKTFFTVVLRRPAYRFYPATDGLSARNRGTAIELIPIPKSNRNSATRRLCLTVNTYVLFLSTTSPPKLTEVDP